MIKLVTDAPGECEIADEARAALERVLADKPRAVLIVYESATHNGCVPVPAAHCVIRGLLDAAEMTMMAEDDD